MHILNYRKPAAVRFITSSLTWRINSRSVEGME